MSTDIHSYLEVKVGGRWRLVQRRWLPRSWGSGYQPYTTRDYYTFGLLAGVRGWVGPIAPPVGWPDDISPPLKRMWRNMADRQPVSKRMREKYGWPGEHSFGYYTARELTEFDWLQGTERVGWMYLADYRRHEASQAYLPRGMVVVGDVPDDAGMVLTPKEVPTYTGDAAVPNGGVVYVEVEWFDTHLDRAGQFLTHMLRVFEEVMDEYGVGLDDVRFLFGFDS